MKTLIVYDISDDNIRNRVAELLKDEGLKRIQKSAFIGELTPAERRMLADVLARMVDARDRIDIFPICDRDLKLWIKIGKGSPL